MTSLTHQKAVQTSYLLGALALVTMPDLVAGLVMEILHLMFEFLHIAFEFLEVILDHAVEHLFHTELHDTQVIVFYTIVSMGTIASYFVLRALRNLWQKLKLSATNNYLEKKTQANLFWGNQSTVEKVKLVAIGSAGLTCIVLFGF